MPKINDIVLVHGGFVDGAGWRGVYDILKKDGFNVSVVQNPTISLMGDVAATKLVIHSQPGPVVLVGHSYGGVVITEAGTDPNVAALVYITAFAPDAGESVNALIANPPPGAPCRRFCRPTAVIYFLTRSNSRLPSPATSIRRPPLSWPTPRCRGASTPLAARSRSRRGSRNPVGISKSATTR
jgi:pimeloyl-ACP methyl ester carboxylesterase